MPRPRKQSGYIYRRAGWWVLRYRENVMEGGQLVRRQLAKKIEPVRPEHMRLKRPPKEIEDLASGMLQPLNSGIAKPEATQTLENFVTSVYFPSLEKSMRASTVKGYKARWESQLKARCGYYRLRDFRTIDGQNILNQVSTENPNLLRSTLVHLRNLLSGIFTEAIRFGYLDGQVTLNGTTKTVAGNPMRGVKIPKAPEGEDTYAYSLEEVTRMLLYLPQPAYTIAAVAAFTGLRRSELTGLLWENYGSFELRVTRSVWEGYINEPKTKKSKAPVPVIPALARILDAYRLQCGSPESGPMFRSEAGTPLNMNNVLNRVILPALNRCQVCKKVKDDHAQADHSYKRDASRPEWHGFHAYRRGLATNLHRLGVPEKTIQAILRHSNLTTTMDIYVKTVSADSAAAMKLLETALCANCAPSPTPNAPAVLN